MAVFKTLRAVLLVTTVAFNVFIYFYPNLLNEASQCTWHKFPHSTFELKSRDVTFNILPEKLRELFLLNFPSFQDTEDTPSAYDDAGKVKDIHMLTFGDPQINGNWPLTKYIKRLDNYGNDYYLGHIYNIMLKRLRPTHVAVMGDLFSLQWIYDLEFYNRTHRYVERLFTRPDEYKKTVIDTWKSHQDYSWNTWLNEQMSMDPDARFASRSYNDVYDWVHKDRNYPNYDVPMFINLTGNHDIGYSGDATWQHMARFEYLFGQDNYVITYNQGKPEEWRIVVLNSMTLEGPALQEEFINFTWSFLDHLEKVVNPLFKGSTVLLTHIPFYKREGLCADGPQHRYYENYEPEPYKNGKLRSQNHLTYETSQKVLNIIFPNADKEGIILTGHDHVGCSNYYNYINNEWVAEKEKSEATTRAPIREVVVRAMMGDFEGQTGLLTGSFNEQTGHWAFNFSYCSFAVQHWWWATKVVTVLLGFISSWMFVRRSVSK